MDTKLKKKLSVDIINKDILSYLKLGNPLLKKKKYPSISL